MLLDQSVDTPLLGSRVMDALLWTVAGVWSAVDNVVQIITAPFAPARPGDDDEEEEGSEEEDEDESALESEHDAWMRCAGIIASRIVNASTSDAALLKQHHQELFELMVSMGIIEFATQGYKFTLSPVISVTPIVS